MLVGDVTVCDICGVNIVGTGIDENEPPPFACQVCKSKYPPALLKATCDPFLYALGLRDGTVVDFESAEIYGEWVTIHGENDESGRSGMSDESGESSGSRWKGRDCPRGVDIRLSEIVWVADAPNGS
jgi:hypothetical protein